MFFQLIIDYKRHFDPGGPKFQYHINASIDHIYLDRLFDPGGTTISSFFSKLIVTHEQNFNPEINYVQWILTRQTRYGKQTNLQLR